MRSRFLVERHHLLDQVVHVPFAKDDEAAKAFLLYGCERTSPPSGRASGGGTRLGVFLGAGEGEGTVVVRPGREVRRTPGRGGPRLKRAKNSIASSPAAMRSNSGSQRPLAATCFLGHPGPAFGRVVAPQQQALRAPRAQDLPLVSESRERFPSVVNEKEAC